MEKKKYPAVNIGSASMLVIFIILCLVTFSVLSVASTNNDRTYAQNIAKRTSDYYDASNKAEELLAKIDELLTKAYSEQGITALDSEAMKKLTYPVDVSDFPVLSFTVPINDTQALAVSLTLQTPNAPGDGFYKITSWKEISTDTWENDKPLNLM